MYAFLSTEISHLPRYLLRFFLKIGWGLDNWNVEVWVPTREWFFSIPQFPGPIWNPPKLTTEIVLGRPRDRGGCSVGDQMAGMWNWQPHAPTVEIRNMWSYKSIPRFRKHKDNFTFISLYRVFQEECARLREGVPYVKLYRCNPKHLCPKLSGYGDKGARKVWSSCGSTYCTWFAWRNTHKLRIVRPCLQPAQARSSLRLHM